MSTRQVGNRSENQFCLLAEELGYATFCARGSRGPVDVICFEDNATIFWDGTSPGPALVVQVGPQAKPVTKTLQELLAAPRPIGSLAIVARKTKMKNGRIKWIFSTEAGKFYSLAEAIEARL